MAAMPSSAPDAESAADQLSAELPVSTDETEGVALKFSAEMQAIRQFPAVGELVNVTLAVPDVPEVKVVLPPLCWTRVMATAQAARAVPAAVVTVAGMRPPSGQPVSGRGMAGMAL